MKCFNRLLAALFVAGALIGTAAAQDTLKKVRDSGSITIGHRDASIPFSYYDDKQQPVGYAIDLCLRIVDAVKNELKMPKLDVKPARHFREPNPANGERHDRPRVRVDDQQPRPAETGMVHDHPLPHHNRWIAKKASNIKALPDLKGKTIVSTAGTTNIKQITEINAAQNLGMNIISANGHPEAFQMVETGRAVAFVMDDILLYSLAAVAQPGDYAISPEALSVEPYGIMLRKDDAV